MQSGLALTFKEYAMRWSPSKDARDYQTRGRWEGRSAPRWLAWLGRGPRTPYRVTLAAGLAGFVVGAVTGPFVGADAFVSAIAGALLVQLAADVWIWRRRSG